MEPSGGLDVVVRGPAQDGLPILIDLARSAEQAETRRAAFFWLAQVDDQRVLGFFDEALPEGRRE